MTAIDTGDHGVYLVAAFVGDYQPEDQPFWGVRFTSKSRARDAADETWKWLRTTWLPNHEAELFKIGSDEICVFVYDTADDTGESPVYARGNPSCMEW